MPLEKTAVLRCRPRASQGLRTALPPGGSPVRKEAEDTLGCRARANSGPRWVTRVQLPGGPSRVLRGSRDKGPGKWTGWRAGAVQPAGAGVGTMAPSSKRVTTCRSKGKSRESAWGSVKECSPCCLAPSPCSATDPPPPRERGPRLCAGPAARLIFLSWFHRQACPLPPRL